MEWLEYIYNAIINFSNSIISVLSYIWSILQSLRYGATTMLSGVYDLVLQIFTSGIF